MPASQPPGVPGNPDPWSYPSETIDLSARPPDVLISPGEAAYEGRPRRRRLSIVVAAATVVALVIGGVAYAGMRLWYGSGAQPEGATPSTVVAFARLDLSPGLGQRRSIHNLARKFPQESGKDAVEELKQGIFEALDVDEALYREHVEPWFAERVGVAWWMDGEKRPYGLIILATKDESAARAGLTELQSQISVGGFGFVIRNGYALVARGDKDSQAAADAAGKDAERESLAASAQFRQGVDWLPGQQTVLGWVDLAKYGQAMKAMMGTAMRDIPTAPGEEPVPGMSPDVVDPMGGALLGLPGLGVFPGIAGPGRWDDLKGRVIMGAQAKHNGVEVRFRGFGTDNRAGAPADARSIVDSLPANSALAGSFRLGDIDEQYAGRGPDPAEMLPEEILKDLPPGEAERMRAEMREDTKRFEATGKALSALSGAKLSITATELGGDGEVPALLAAAETASAAQATKLVEAVQLLFPDQVTISASGSKVELKTERYVAESGTLAGLALYEEALDGAPQEATGVLYVDVQRMLAHQRMTDQERREAQPVKAIGLATGTDGGDQVGLLRVVIR